MTGNRYPRASGPKEFPAMAISPSRRSQKGSSKGSSKNSSDRSADQSSDGTSDSFPNRPPRPRRPLSEKKLAANRANAKKSTGPRTAAGKSRSRFNAVRHGLTASVGLLPGEDGAALHDLSAAVHADLRPRGQAE